MQCYLSGFSNKYHLENKLHNLLFLVQIVVLQLRLTLTKAPLWLYSQSEKDIFQLSLDTNHFNQYISHIRDMADLMADQLCLAYEEYTDFLQLGTM